MMTTATSEESELVFYGRLWRSQYKDGRKRFYIKIPKNCSPLFARNDKKTSYHIKISYNDDEDSVILEFPSRVFYIKRHRSYYIGVPSSLEVQADRVYESGKYLVVRLKKIE